MHRQKAQALIAVLLLLAVVGTLVGGLGSIWQAESKTRASERQGMQAFYLAQAGMERAKIWVSNNIDDDGPFHNGWFPSSTTWYVLGADQRYRFMVTDLGGDKRRIQAYGQVLDANNNMIAEKAIQVDLDDVNEDPDVDPRDAARVISGTWKQF